MNYEFEDGGEGDCSCLHLVVNWGLFGYMLLDMGVLVAYVYRSVCF